MLHNFRLTTYILLFAGLSAWMAPAIKTTAANDKPLALHPANPHYFLFRGEPVVIITSGEHYGAVMNLDFDYVKYLDALRRDGMNHTRVFTGAAYVEPQGAFKIERNSMAPAPGRYLAPPGKYAAEWIETKTGVIAKREEFNHERGARKLAAPDYQGDIALRLRR